MKPAERDWTAFNNENWVTTIPFVEAGTETPLDLGKLSFAMQLRRAGSAVQVDLRVSTITGELRIHPDEPGLLCIDVPRSRVSGLAGDYAYDLVAWPHPYTDETQVWMTGTITVKHGVTRDVSQRS